MQQRPWFVIDDLYSSHYAVTRGGVGGVRSDVDADANMDDEEEAREGGNVGKDE